MSRIAIIGAAGAGKSWLARELGARLGLPVIHLDRLYWKPGWVPTPREQWRALQRELVAGARWIIDGNYDGTLELRVAAAEVVIYLDAPRSVCVSRVLRRALTAEGRRRADIGPGCPERVWTADFWRFLVWIWRYREDNRPRVLEVLRRCGAGRRVIVLRSDREVRAFVRGIRPTGERAP